MRIRRFFSSSILAAMLSVGIVNTVQAVPMPFTSRAAFDAALGGYVQSTVDFDGLTAGDLIPDGGTLDGITFDYPGIAGFVTMQVQAGPPSQSAPNVLGTTDGGVFLDGDFFDLGFASSNAIGLYFITETVPAHMMFDDDLTLQAGGASVSLVAADIEATVGIYDIYFLGIADTVTAFTSASISTPGNFAFTFQIDDIVTAAPQPTDVSEPGHLALLSLGLVLAAGRRRRRR